MNDHSGNIIYIIVVIIAVISSLVSKAKKAAKGDKPTPSFPQKSWQDVIREITMENEAPVPAGQQPVRQVIPPPQQPMKQVEPKPFLNSEAKIHNRKETAKSTAPSLYQSDQRQISVSLPDFSNYDDIRKGIIFNEIFNRKF